MGWVKKRRQVKHKDGGIRYEEIDVRVCDRCGGIAVSRMKDTSGGLPEEFDVCQRCRSKLLILAGFVDAFIGAGD